MDPPATYAHPGYDALMPLIEIIPTTGSIASAIIALFAAGVLMRDGLLVAVSTLFLLTVPVMVWHFGFNK